MVRTQDSDLAHFYGDWSQSEKLSEIKPPLKQLRLEAKNTTFIFHVREPPTLTSSLGNWSENFFDATMTYRRDSDIFNALYELVPKITMSSSTVYNQL